MFKPISDKVSLPDLEKEILAYWKTNRIFEKSVEGRQNAPDYTFYEGPPTANGKPGIVTSGTQTPFLKKAIGLAYLPIEATAPGTKFEVDIRARRTPARVVPLPFYKRAR